MRRVSTCPIVGMDCSIPLVKRSMDDGDTACGDPRRSLFDGRFRSSAPNKTKTEKDQLEIYVGSERLLCHVRAAIANRTTSNQRLPQP